MFFQYCQESHVSIHGICFLLLGNMLFIPLIILEALSVTIAAILNRLILKFLKTGSNSFLLYSEV